MQCGEPSCQITTEDPPVDYCLSLHVDTDRTGHVDAKTARSAAWSWGPKGRGAIVMVNCDADGAVKNGNGDHVSDNTDTSINGPSDLQDVEPLEVWRTGPIPDSVKAFLLVDKPKQLRIFNSLSANAFEVLGPDHLGPYALPSPLPEVLTLGMEGVQHPGKALDDPTKEFDGEVRITLFITDDAAGVSQLIQTVVVRVTPWTMPHHLLKASHVYVAIISASDADITAVTKQYTDLIKKEPSLGCTDADCHIKLRRALQAMHDNKRFRDELRALVEAAGGQLIEHGQTNDRWTQDCMELGHTRSARRWMHTVLTLPRGGELQKYPNTLLSAETGHIEIKNSQNSLPSVNYGGNIEVTPPVKLKHRNYPLGRIYYGPGTVNSPIDPNLKAFLKSQRVQDPFPIDTNWLYVGHVDEFVTFIPTRSKDSPQFTMLIASPKRALDILGSIKDRSTYTIFKDIAAHDARDRDLFFPREVYFQHMSDYAPIPQQIGTSVEAFLRDGLPSHNLTFQELAAYNLECQAKIDLQRLKFISALGLREQDIVHVPQLYIRDELTSSADALTGGMVNMLVMNNHCIVPKPFGPTSPEGVDLFWEALNAAVTAAGCKATPLNCWYEYHVMKGEIHCGTNTLRLPGDQLWWNIDP